MASQQPSQVQTTETKNLTVAQINVARRIKQALGAMQALEQRNTIRLMGVEIAISDEEGKGSSSSTSKPDEGYENVEKNLKELNLK
ncbi:hypothetical protein Patl1_08165 [Pistacia atlantica]|uniref:Uncharacterized protein n=1 Tax=Pistacia atlantica TaxID=434234 RepID=A0ACC1AHH6_9ROSI|nr:hypothetical protein Patl1_08165 [Pistacia atlantica]